MKSSIQYLKDLFNHRNDKLIKLSTLAEIIAPVFPLAHLDNRASYVGKGFEELSDWVRIGFHHETEKGRDATALIIALRQIGESINRADKNQIKDGQVYIDKEDLRILRSTYWQMTAAAEGLRMIAKTQSNTPDLRITIGKDGVKRAFADYSNVIPIYNRPEENHEATADKLGEISARLDRFFVSSDIRPASALSIQRKADFAKFYR